MPFILCAQHSTLQPMITRDALLLGLPHLTVPLRQNHNSFFCLCRTGPRQGVCCGGCAALQPSSPCITRTIAYTSAEGIRVISCSTVSLRWSFRSCTVIVKTLTSQSTFQPSPQLWTRKKQDHRHKRLRGAWFSDGV